MLAFFAFSMGQSFGFDSNLFGGRNQFLCFGESSDIVKLNDAEPKAGALASGLFRRYSFNIEAIGNQAECTSSGDGDVDLYMCSYSDAEKCIAESSIKSTSGTSSETVTSPIISNTRTWYIIVRGNAISTYTITCNEI